METKMVNDENKFIGKFKIQAEIGKGGMGKIYLAEDTKLKRKVALKTISKEKLTEKSRDRFLQELRIVANFDHPNICKIFEVDDSDEPNYVAMEYIDGDTLESIIEEKTLKLDKLELVDIAIQICNGILEAHSQGIIHRDLKPGNIMVDKKGIVKILDFGIFKLLNSKTSLTDSGNILGTPSYMSPEQVRGEPLDLRTDIFSFGIILYEMLKNENPFKGDGGVTTLFNIQNEGVNLEGIPEGLKPILEKCLAKEKEKRYSSFEGVKRDLEKFKEYSIKKNKYLKFLIPGGAILVIVIVLAFFFFHSHNNIGIFTINQDQDYIFLNKFDDKEQDGVPDKLDYLINESLNQFPQFKSLNYSDLIQLGITEMSSKADELKKKNIILKYEIKGKVSQIEENYTIEAEVLRTTKPDLVTPITISGDGQDSFLTHQIETLSNRVFRVLYGKDPKDSKKISDMYGEKWGDFESFWEALEYFKKEEWDKAREGFEKSKNVLLSRYYLAMIAYRLGDNADTVKYFGIIQKEKGKLYDYWRIQVLLLQAKAENNFNRKLEYLKELRKTFGFRAQIYFEIGEAYFHECEITKAIKNYERAVELDQNYSEALNHLGYCYSYIGDHHKAIDSFEKYRRDDQTANSFDSLGDGHFYAGDLVQAEAMKIRALSEGSTGVPWAYLSLSDIYILKAEFNKANQSLEKYYELIRQVYKDESVQKKFQALVFTRKAYIYYIEGKYKKALEAINQSLSNFDSADLPNNTSEAHWLKGQILLALDELVKSKEELKWLTDFTHTYQLSPGNSTLPFKYMIHLQALILEKENRISKAEDSFKYLIRIKEKLSYWATYYNYQFFHTEYANFLYRQGEYWRALEEIERCLQFNQNYIPALWIKAKLEEKLDAEDTSSKIYQKIDELYGKSEETNDLRNLLKIKLGNIGKENK